MKVFGQLGDVNWPGDINSACAIGQFDGVHLGHQMVLSNALRKAAILNGPSVVFTFANHPQSLISKTPTPLLSTLDERLERFEVMGFDAALVLAFTPELMAMPAVAFVQQILIETLHVKAVSVGYDHRFGKDRQGDGAFLSEQGKQHGFDVVIVEPVSRNHQIISSTVIRKLLTYGDLTTANALLGYPYPLTGTVVHGLGRGQQINVPTANIELPPNRLLPANGVYAGYATLLDSHMRWPAVANMGVCPTFGAQATPRLEVHLLDYDGETLYGRNLRFECIDRLRPEQSFASVEALVEQIQLDIAQARQILQHPTTVH
ncbi:MAG: bifunctional riboflavin kinase/FAD synthetase [Cyanobacteria bacterium HKST-UBA06]|nr:bifunctional riboflavin kinase/FAD synthetase [Cyanobacteria bacterium HKST-UBA06]